LPSWTSSSLSSICRLNSRPTRPAPVPARVAWTGAGRVGLEFKRQIDESELLVQLGKAPSSSNQQRFRRPAINASSLTDQERRLARLWGVSVGINFNGD